MDFGFATARGIGAVVYLKTSIYFIALLTRKLKSWQSSFTTDKVFKNFFFSYPVVNRYRKFQRMIFYPPLTCLGEKPRNVCLQLPLHAKDMSNFFINFSTSCEFITPCLNKLSFCLFYYCMNLWYSLRWMRQQFSFSFVFLWKNWVATQAAFTCSKLTTETLKKGVKYVQS